MNLVNPPNHLNLFPLPDWARWCSWVTLTQDFKIQIASLKYPRWDMSFYPVFIGSSNSPLFPFPKDLEEASRDGRLWHCCPEKLWYSADLSQIIFEDYDEGDHPRPPHSARYLVSSPNYHCTLIEEKTGDYSQEAGAQPRLSTLQGDFHCQSIQLLPGNEGVVLSKVPSASPPWPVETRKRK